LILKKNYLFASLRLSKENQQITLVVYQNIQQSLEYESM
jgi:hypothetical protein